MDDAAVLDAPEIETPDVDTTVDTATPVDKPEGEKFDGRKTPDALRKTLSTLKASDDPVVKAHATELNNALGKKLAYEAEFPTVREAREVKALIESVGGREAIASMQATVANVEQVDEALERGDPSILDDIFKQAPEGMVKLAGPILDRVAQINPQAYKEAVQPHAVKFIEDAGFVSSVNGLIEAFNAKDWKAVHSIVQGMGDWYNAAQGSKTKAQPNPDRQKFEQEKTEFEQQKVQGAVKEAFDGMLTHAGDSIDKALAPQVARLKLGKEATEALRGDVWRYIERARNNDANFKATINSKFNGKTPKADAVAYLNGFTDRLLKEAVEKTIALRYGFIKNGNVTRPKTNPTAQPQKPSEALKVSAPPKREDIDYSDKRTKPFDGVAVRKSDKRLVTWR